MTSAISIEHLCMEFGEPGHEFHHALPAHARAKHRDRAVEERA